MSCFSGFISSMQGAEQNIRDRGECFPDLYLESAHLTRTTLRIVMIYVAVKTGESVGFSTRGVEVRSIKISV